MKLWVCLSLVVFAFGFTKAQNNDDYDAAGFWDDYWWSSEADDVGIVDENVDKINKDTDSDTDTKIADVQEKLAIDKSDKIVLEDIDKFRKSLENDDNKEEPLDLLGDYQFEDNRSEIKEQVDIPMEAPNYIGEIPEKENKDNSKEEIEHNDGEPVQEHIDDDSIAENFDILEKDNKAADNTGEQEVNIGADEKADATYEEEVILEDPEPLEENANDSIFQETRDILAKDDKTANDQEVSLGADERSDTTFEEDITFEDSETLIENNNDDIFDETRNILAQDDDSADTSDKELDTANEQDTHPKDLKLSAEKQNQKDDSVTEEEIKNLTNEEETEDEIGELFEVLDNLGSRENEEKEPKISQEIDELFDKLNNEHTDDELKENIDDTKNKQNENGDAIKDNEVSNNEQNDEDTVEKAYADLSDDLQNLFKTWDKLTKDDDNLDDQTSTEEKTGEMEASVLLNTSNEQEEIRTNSNGSGLATNNKNFESVEDVDSKKGSLFYSDDALVANKEQDSVSKDVSSQNKEPIHFETSGQLETPVILKTEPTNDDQKQAESALETVATKEETSTPNTIKVEDLTPKQYDALMQQFVQVHDKELDTESEGFSRNVAAIHMQLSVDEPTVVTSPNYPRPYPTNNIVDWIFDGEGTGIELNITDFAVNGVLGDYLMVKPGGLDASGSDGLIFSYTLTSPRRFRFLDVDRMFVRFQSNQGLAFMRGFEMSVRMIRPLVPERQEPEPTPEPVLPEPKSQLTVNIGGIQLAEFKEIEEQFRQLVADMATFYINANGLEMGVNTTNEVTQITKSKLCNINWPGFENCVTVRFAVPLVLEDGPSDRLHEEDLTTMWYTYIYQDPFATRLRRMGITEFEIPNHDRVLMTWLIIGSGILISVALLAFALWRFSCFEDYTRMATYSDTDSLQNEKRDLDLYPTPHQALPPLYAEPDFKWDDPKFDDSSRVDMGGFTNRTFVRDELLDIDSDEDIVVSRNDIRPKDIYPV